MLLGKRRVRICGECITCEILISGLSYMRDYFSRTYSLNGVSWRVAFDKWWFRASLSFHIQVPLTSRHSFQYCQRKGKMWESTGKSLTRKWSHSHCSCSIGWKSVRKTHLPAKEAELCHLDEIGYLLVAVSAASVEAPPQKSMALKQGGSSLKALGAIED